MFGGRPAAGRRALRGGGYRRRPGPRCHGDGRHYADEGPARRRRVHLPTGKEVEVKIPAGLADGQQIRLKGQGMPGPRGVAGDVLITVTIARIRSSRSTAPTCGSTCRSRFMRRCSAPRCACRPSTARWSCDSRRHNSGRTFRSRARACRQRRGRSPATVAYRAAGRRDAELEELMKKWRDGKPYDPRKI